MTKKISPSRQNPAAPLARLIPPGLEIEPILSDLTQEASGVPGEPFEKLKAP